MRATKRSRCRPILAGKWSASTASFDAASDIVFGETLDECCSGAHANVFAVCRTEFFRDGCDRRSRDERAARQRAADDQHRAVQRRHQSADALRLSLYVAGLRPGHSKPQHRNPVRPVADGAACLFDAGISRRVAGAHAVPGRNPVRCRPAGFDPDRACDAAAARRQADADAAAAAGPRPGARLHGGHGTDRLPRHALDSDLPDRAVPVPPGDRHDGAVGDIRDRGHDNADRTDVARRRPRGDGRQRAAAGARGRDATQRRSHSRTRHDGALSRALGAGQRALPAREHPRDRCACESGRGRQGPALCPAIGHARGRCLSRCLRQGIGRRHDRLLDHDGSRTRAGRGRARQLEAARRRAPGSRGCARSAG